MNCFYFIIASRTRKRVAENHIVNSSDEEADEDRIAGHCSRREFVPIKPAHAQDRTEKKIAAMESQLNSRLIARGTELAEPDNLKQISVLEKKLAKSKSELKRL
ncbi:hypothetical protein FOCC_FOCC012396 [Frankliniella occidentalis]|nr:hypothetical protein FOCC_FOCC012396 [Frankliniella occidentalis]